MLPPIAGAAALLTAMQAAAQPINAWNGGVGNWFDGGNWSNGVPTALNSTDVDNAGVAQISSPGAIAGFLTVGRAGDGTLQIFGSGALTSSEGNLGSGSDTTGLVEVNGGTWITSGRLELGRFGDGTLKISGDGTVSNAEASLGVFSDSSGRAEVSSGTWTADGDLTVALSGDGTLIISDTGRVVSTTGNIGSGGTGLADVGGGSWTTSGRLTVGRAGDGTLKISGTGAVSNAGGTIADFSGSTGLVEISAGTWTNAGILEVGSSGRGTLEISGTGAVTSTFGTIGVGISGIGLAEVGAGTWTMTDTLAVGGFGRGTLRIFGTGAVSSRVGNIGVFGASNGLAEISAGTWTISENLGIGINGRGTLTISGTGVVTNTNGIIGDGGISTGLVEVTGGRWTNSGLLTVGNSGNGTLRISGTGMVANTGASIAAGAGSVGLVEVGGGNWTNSGDLLVGALGDGTLTVSGGRVSNVDGYVGRFDGSVGIANIDGGTWANSGFLAVGFGGNGTLNLTGGTVSNTRGAIGVSSGSSGTANVSGGAWSNSETLVVGDIGGGALNISGGGVSNTDGYIGFFSDPAASGAASVTGGVWTNAGTLAVGHAGAGTLRISGTGAVTSTAGVIGSLDTAVGVVEVEGGSWANAGQLEVGRSGDGTLTLIGGTVAAPTTTLATNADATGVLNIGAGANAGVLDTAVVTGGAGDATLNFNHNAPGYFFTDTGTADGVGIGIAGGTKVNHLGSGTTVLTGVGTYTGPTNIAAGTVWVNGSLGDTATTVAGGATLGGSGVIGGGVTVLSGGILAPGESPGVLTVGSLALQPGAITRMEINGAAAGTQHDQVVVTNNASLDGTLDLNFGTPAAAGDRFTLIEAGSFTLQGDAADGFATINDNLGEALVARILVDPTTFSVLVSWNFTGLARTPNQLAVAEVLQAEIDEPGLLDLVDGLNALSAERLPGAFDELAPEEMAALPEFVFNQSRMQTRRLSGRMQEIRRGSTAPSPGVAESLSLEDFLKRSRRSSLAAAADDFSSMAEPSRGLLRGRERERKGAEGWDFFAAATGNYGDVAGDGQVDGYDFAGSGFDVGADLRLAEEWVVGIYGGYQRAKVDFDFNGSEVAADTGSFGVFSTWFDGRGNWVEGQVGGSLSGFDTTRSVLGTNVEGDTTARAFTATLKAGRDFRMGKDRAWSVTPALGLSYDHLRLDNFTETGSPAALAIRERTAESLVNLAEVRVSWRRERAGVVWAPYASIGWRHEFLDDRRAVGARFAQGAGTVFEVDGARRARDGAAVSAGLDVRVSETLGFSFGYAGEVAEDARNHQGQAGVWSRF
jgi:outer membrane autotransporter protein